MSRSRKALITAGFTYLQLAIAIGFSIFVTRFLIHRLGESLYGLWLASGQLLAYAAFADLGVFAVLPWLIAEADGKKDERAIRSLVAHGFLAGVAISAIYLTIAVVCWFVFPSVLHLSQADRATLGGPLGLLVVATVLGYPLRVFSALRAGLQDVAFTGLSAMLQPVVSNLLTIALVYRGWGLMAVATGTVAPSILAGVAALVRSTLASRRYLRELPRVHWKGAQAILTGGTGAWMSGIGWQLAFGSDNVVLGYLGARDRIASFAVTSRLGQMMMQLAWTLPDSALIGVAQLKGEGAKDRVAQVVTAIIGLNVLAAGLVACGVLAVNPGVTRIWVGQHLFGGLSLNATFAADVVVLSFAHGLVTTVSVLGERAKVGIVTLLNGLVHIVLAIPLGHAFGLTGVAAATLVSAFVTTIPASARWLRGATGTSFRSLVRSSILPWFLRVSPLLVFAFLLGRTIESKNLFVLALGGSFVAVVYILLTRSLLRELPIPIAARTFLVRLRLL